MTCKQQERDVWYLHKLLSELSTDQRCLVMKGCIIWHSKHVSSNQARATNLICHILRGKWTTRWPELLHSVYVLRGSLTCCYTDQAPGTVTAFQRVFLQWSDCFRPVCLPANQLLKHLEEVCSCGARAARYLPLFLLYSLSDMDQSIRHFGPGLHKWL